MENSKYSLNNASILELESNIVLPSFQRNLVWTKDKKISFISAVIKGNPFGTLLLYKQNLNSFLLVDGLQRYSTLIEFNKNPLSFIKLYDIHKDLIDELTVKLRSERIRENNSSISREKVISLIQSEMKFGEQDEEGKIIANIADQISEHELKADTRELICNIVYKTKKLLDISSLKIHYILYNGQYDELANIYFEINSNGTSLTKYEIFAARWNKIIFQNIEDRTILYKIDNKYLSMQENSSIIVENYSQGSIVEKKEINLFEYCYALGKILQDNCNYLLNNSSNKEKSDVDSIGFALLNCILSNSKRKIEKLSDYFSKNCSNDLVKLKDKIIICAKKVEEILNFYMLPTSKKESFYRYKENCIICMITTLFKIKYVNKGGSLCFLERTDSKKEFISFEKNMPLRFLYDVITNYWDSSGDKNLEQELALDLIDNRFLNQIGRETWEVALHNFLTEEHNKPMKNAQREQKLLITFIFSEGLKKVQFNKNYTTYNIIPKQILNKKLGTDARAVCATGNLFVFQQVKDLKNNNFYEVIDDNSLNLNESILLKCGYPERNEIHFYNNEFSFDKYLKFLKNRENYLINKFIDTYLK